MSDQAMGQPVRSEADGTDQRVQVKIVDKTSPGTQQMTVDTDSNAHVESHGNDPAGVDRVQILTEEGRSTTRGDYNVSTNTKPSSNAAILHSRQTTPTEVHQTLRPTGINSSVNTSVWAQDVAMRDEDGNPFTTANPLPVTSVDSEGTEVNAYNTASAVAAAAVSNHDYTVTALKTLKLSGVRATASARSKIEIQIESGVGTNTFATVAVSFNSVSDPDMWVPLPENVTVAAGVRVRVIRTNRDLLAMDLYSTIMGHEIP